MSEGKEKMTLREKLEKARGRIDRSANRLNKVRKWIGSSYEIDRNDSDVQMAVSCLLSAVQNALRASAKIDGMIKRKEKKQE